jgi:hypothetical protein
MLEHLEELQLSETAYDLIPKMESWLTKSGQYALAARMRHLDECISEGWQDETAPLGDEAVKLIIKVMLS